MAGRDGVTGLPNLLTTTERVAPVRSRRSIYLDMLPPCNAGCPVGGNVQEWLHLIKADQYEAAWRQFTAGNPFPAIHGRVCYHPCETACNHKDLDAAVSIHLVERYLEGLALERGWRFETPSCDSGRRVLIIDVGSLGLPAAYHLRRLGHEMKIRDSADAPGGMMRYGIPEYRLSRDALDAEVVRITDVEVVIRNNTPVTDLLATQVAGCFGAVLVVIGAHLPKRVDAPPVDATKTVNAVSFPRDVAKGERLVIGRRVAVYDGGNTAMSAVCVARRLGVEESVIVYHRTVEQIPTHTEERESAKQEGVRMNWLRIITEMGEEDLTVEIVEFDEEDKAHGTGRFERLAADTVTPTARQEVDTGFLHTILGMIFDRGAVRIDPDTLITNVPGIFARDDMVPSECTVAIDAGHGKETAHCIDRQLDLDVAPRDPKHPLVHLDQMSLWYFDDHTRWVQAEQTPETRISDPGEVVTGLSPKETELEARRCLSCGNCFECDGCYGACPEDAVVKLGPGNRYRFDYRRCTGCVIYYEQYPVYVIKMIPEGQR